MNIHLNHGELKVVPIGSLKLFPGNRNKHNDAQLDHLMKIYEYQGMRQPLTVNADDGSTIVCGNGRFLAAKKAGLKEVPVLFQKFESNDQMYAHHVADNAIGLQAELDLAGINEDLAELDGATFDVDWLGIKDFKIDLNEESSSSKEKTKEAKKQVCCPNCDYKWFE